MSREREIIMEEEKKECLVVAMLFQVFNKKDKDRYEKDKRKKVGERK